MWFSIIFAVYWIGLAVVVAIVTKEQGKNYKAWFLTALFLNLFVFIFMDREKNTYQ